MVTSESSGFTGGTPCLYCVGALFKHLYFERSVHRSEQRGIVAQNASDDGMVRREGSFIDRQRTLIEGFGLLVAPLLL